MTSPLPSISCIIPTFNMGSFLPQLFQSLASAKVLDCVQEVIFVDDGSTDDTAAVLRRLAADAPSAGPRVVASSLATNQGRFLARLHGARLAKGERLLFLDARLTLQPEFGAALARLAPEHPSLMGCVDIDVRRNVFCLYWQRSHEAIFRHHYRDTQKPLLLTSANYDAYLKGTGVFLCSREVFLRSCEKYEPTPLASDDTLLMRDMVASEPILIHPELRIDWVPRDTALSFLARLWERGPGFVEYHVCERRGRFFYAVMLGLVLLLAWLVLLCYAPAVGLGAAIALLAIAAVSVVLFAKDLRECVRLMPLHLAVILTFGLGTLRGLVVNLRRLWRRGPPPAVALPTSSSRSATLL